MNTKSRRNEKPKWIVLLAVLAITAVLLGLFWCFRISSQTVREEIVVRNERNFVIPYGEITGVGFSYGKAPSLSEKASVPETVRVELLNDEGEIVYQKEAEQIVLGTDYSILQKALVPEEIKAEKGELYSVRVFSNGERIEDISIALYGEPKSLWPYYMRMAVWMLIILGVGGTVFCLQPRVSFRGVVLFWFVGLGLLWNFSFAPLNAPDEVVHFGKAYEISNFIMGERSPDENLWVRGSGIQNLQFNGNMQYMTCFWDNHAGNEAEQFVFSAKPYVRVNLPYYWPALGITAARVMGASYQWVVFSGRLMNLAFYAVMLYFSMRVVPKDYEKAIAAVFLLPGVLSIAASYSYDIWINAFVLFFVSYCLHCRQRGTLLRPWEWAALIFSVMMFAPVKVIYLLMAAVIFLVPKTCFRRGWHRLLLAGIAVTAGAGMIVIVQGTGLLYMLGIPVHTADAGKQTRIERQIQVASEADALPVETVQSEEDGAVFLQEEQNEGYSLSYILHNPRKTFLVCIGDVFKEADYLIKQCLVGNGTPLHATPDIIVYTVLTAFIMIMIRPIPAIQERRSERFWCIALAMAGIVSILVTFLFSNSYIQQNGVGQLLGVQGRYFVPYLLLLPLMMQCGEKRISSVVEKGALAAIPLCNFAVLLNSFAYVALK